MHKMLRKMLENVEYLVGKRLLFNICGGLLLCINDNIINSVDYA